MEQKDTEETGSSEPRVETQAPAPPPEGEGAGSGSKKSGGISETGKVLVIVGMAVIVLLNIATLTAVLMLSDNGHGAIGGQRNTPLEGRPMGQIRGRFPSESSDGEVQRVSGQVAAMDAKSLTVRTEKGDVTLSMTETTRYPGGPGMDQGDMGQAPQPSIAVGDEVDVMARKADDGSLSAISVRKAGTQRPDR